MKFALITGSVVATKKVEKLAEQKLLLARECDQQGKAYKSGGHFVLEDLVSAGYGDVVLLTEGSSCRNTTQTHDRPVDALAIGIVDLIYEEDKESYRKN